MAQILAYCFNPLKQREKLEQFEHHLIHFVKKKQVAPFECYLRSLFLDAHIHVILSKYVKMIHSQKEASLIPYANEHKTDLFYLK